MRALIGEALAGSNRDRHRDCKGAARGPPAWGENNLRRGFGEASQRPRIYGFQGLKKFFVRDLLSHIKLLIIRLNIVFLAAKIRLSPQIAKRFKSG